MGIRKAYEKLVVAGLEIVQSIAGRSRYVPRAELDKAQEKIGYAEKMCADITETLDARSEDLKTTSKSLNNHIVDRIGLERRIKEQDHLLQHQKLKIRNLRTADKKDFEEIFNGKPHGRPALAFATGLGEIYLQNQSATNLTGGDFCGVNLSNQIPFGELQEGGYGVMINGGRYNAFPKALPSGRYKIIFKKPGIFQKMAHKKNPSHEDLVQKGSVLKSQARAEVAKRQARKTAETA
ncbi:hypothetical protein HOA55_03245 [archaeon]|jgi:hypothetical protein|nr:hypothetical protein [archaeon]MBT3577412.1 hypothetical protein [archaeon]MBT6820345.1 hypothetical protein [archaeon]MBT6956104.1 hypothetical protein [archaeon]MBT7025159.1 hypothetical protein [archaeon]